MGGFISSAGRGAREYWSHLSLFSRNARLFLLNGVIISVAMAMVDVVMNFYLVSLGYRTDFIGQLAAVGQGTVFFAALPATVLSEHMGRKQALIAAALTLAAALAGYAYFTSVEGIVALRVLFGLGLALAMATLLPYLMENSTAAERTHLFSMNQAVAIGAGFAGNFIGGGVPGWAASAFGFGARDPQAYQATLALAALVTFASVLPLLRMRSVERTPGHGARRVFSGVRADRVLIAKILLPNLLISIGAGLLIPFNNLFARTRFGFDDAQVGTLFSVMSLLGGAAIVSGPVLANRFGRMPTVVLAQGISTVMLALLGFAPARSLAMIGFMLRPGFMQMSGPLFDSYSMERLRPESRAALASLNQMMWTVGMVISPPLSGRLQLEAGWEPIILGMIALYVAGNAVTYLFFVRHGPNQPGGSSPEA